MCIVAHTFVSYDSMWVIAIIENVFQYKSRSVEKVSRALYQGFISSFVIINYYFSNHDEIIF